MAGRANRLFIAAAILFLGASIMSIPGAYAQDDQDLGYTPTAIPTGDCESVDDASLKMLCKMKALDNEAKLGFDGIMLIFKVVMLAVTIGVVVVIVFKRMTAKDGEDPMTGAKNVLYIMIIATAIIWIGTEFIVGGTTGTPDVDDGCPDGQIPAYYTLPDGNDGFTCVDAPAPDS